MTAAKIVLAVIAAPFVLLLLPLAFWRLCLLLGMANEVAQVVTIVAVFAWAFLGFMAVSIAVEWGRASEDDEDEDEVVQK